MANKSKRQVKEELTKLGIPVTTDNYQELCALLKSTTVAGYDDDAVVEVNRLGDILKVAADKVVAATDESEYRADSCGECLEFETPKCVARVSDELACSDFSTETSAICVHIENRIRKRNIFLADSVRNERDVAFLNKEIGQRKYKGKIVSITTIKYCEVSAEGEWVTSFDIELKEQKVNTVRV
jgi:hypothetical protein